MVAKELYKLTQTELQWVQQRGDFTTSLVLVYVCIHTYLITKEFLVIKHMYKRVTPKTLSLSPLCTSLIWPHFVRKREGV